MYDKCNPSPCGANADCNDGVCKCKNNFIGNPYMSCRPECTHNSDCAPNLACYNNKCYNPCTNLCGENASCDVYNHIPMCSCPPNSIGNAFFKCIPEKGIKTILKNSSKIESIQTSIIFNNYIHNFKFNCIFF